MRKICFLLTTSILTLKVIAQQNFQSTRQLILDQQSNYSLNEKYKISFYKPTDDNLGKFQVEDYGKTMLVVYSVKYLKQTIQDGEVTNWYYITDGPTKTYNVLKTTKLKKPLSNKYNYLLELAKYLKGNNNSSISLMYLCN